MKQSEQDLRDVYGDEFVDNLNENFDIDSEENYEEEYKEYVPMKKSFRQRAYEFFSNPYVFYTVGLIDGILVNMYLKYLGLM